jgi:hypothetical protein
VNPEAKLVSFVLRFVVEEPDGGSGPAGAPPPDWYSVIRHVQSDTERHFTRWEDIVAFIAQYVDLTVEVKHDEDPHRH